MRRIAKPLSIRPESHQWHNKTASECTPDKRDSSPPRAPLFEQARLDHIFAAQDRGAVINVSSMTGISSSPWNAEYGAGKAYILKLTEAVACECEKTGVDVEVCTLGTTLTPTAMKNFPKGPVGEQVVKLALTPDEVADEAFEKLGKEFSIITGERNKKSVHDWKANHTEDEYIRYMGSFYADQD